MPVVVATPPTAPVELVVDDDDELPLDLTYRAMVTTTPAPPTRSSVL
jgi:hypothetical protein